MAAKQKVLFVGEVSKAQADWLDALRIEYDVSVVEKPLRALARLASEPFVGIFVGQEHLRATFKLGKLLQNEQILESMPDGLVVLDDSNTIILANERFRNWSKADDVVGLDFYKALGSPEILGPDYCPLRTAMTLQQTNISSLRVEGNQYFQVHAAPILEKQDPSRNLIVSLRDVTDEVLQRQKLEAIHKAGTEMTDLPVDDLYEMGVEERIEFLKDNILDITNELLKFDVVEIRLLDQITNELKPLLSVGIDSEAAKRNIYALPEGNGVTGFVAHSKKSYLCEDTTNDPLYVTGFTGAKSSMTVPLVLHDEVIGTFNVESPEPCAFTENDMLFIDIFSRDVAVALNTLELLAVQHASAAHASVEAIHRVIALPIDEILLDAVHLMELHQGQNPEMKARLKKILRNARDIKSMIQEVGQQMAPDEAVPRTIVENEHPKLRDCHVLVVDEDEAIRHSAHQMLEQYECIVETAHQGSEAVNLVRNGETKYDAIISAIHLPDMNGNDLLIKLQKTLDPVPLILMSGFGYDPDHTIVKARRAGLKSKSVLFKPFRLDQLIDTLETTLDP